MNQIKLSFPHLFLLMLVTSLSFNCFAQDKDVEKEKQVASLVESKEFIFVAEAMQPLRGGNRQLTSRYDLRLTLDSLNSQLPYIGRAQNVSLDPSQQGLSFISTQFEVKADPPRKGKWDLVIKPTDNREVREMRLTVFTNGTATLQVTSNNRDPITYRGYIEPVK